MTSYYIALSLHLLGATVWVGGHLVLALSILPRALADRRAATVTEFEHRFERLGLPALALQVVTGLWLGHRLLGDPSAWFDATPIARVVQIKLALLVATVGLALHARLRLIPRLGDDTLVPLAWHIRAVTALAVLFVLAGASARVGGYPVFD